MMQDIERERGARQGAGRGPLLWPWLVVIAFNGALATWLGIGIGGEDVSSRVAAAGNILGSAIALWWCLPRRCSSARARWCLAAFSVAALLDVIAHSCWYYYEMVLEEAPFPSLADVSYLAEYPLLILGILLLPARPASVLKSGRIVLDSVITIAAVSIFSWYFVVGPILLQAEESALAKALSAAYPILDLVVLFCLLVVSAQVGGMSVGRVVAPLSAGLIVLAVSDTIFGYQSARGTYESTTLLEVGWPLGYMLLAAGCLGLRAAPAAQVAAPAGGATARATFSFWRSLLPHLAGLSVVALTLHAHRFHHDPRLNVLEVGTLGLLVLILTRQMMAMKEKAQLYDRLRGAYAQLAEGHASLAAAHATLERSDQALRQSEERFRVASEHATDLIYDLDLATNQLQWSGAVDRQLGYGVGEFPRTLEAWKHALHPLDRPRVSEALERCIARGEPFSVQYRIMRKNGTWLHWTDRGATIRDTSGKPARMIGAISDVTAAKQAEATLRMQKALLESQSESSIDGIMVLSPHGGLLSFNRRLAEMWDLPPGLCEARRGVDVLAAIGERASDRAAFGARVAKLGEDRYAAVREEVALQAGHTFDCYSAPLYGADGTHFGRVWYFRDITAHKRSAALERERIALRESVASMERVLGVVGHELRTPLAGVRAICEMLLTDCQGQVEQSRTFLHGMYEEVVRMADTVNNLLEAARINSGRARWNWSVFALAGACHEALEAVRPLTEGGEVALSFGVTPPDATMRGDADAVRRLILNLVNNARKHTTAGSIRVSVTTAGERDGWIEISVTDTGSGIPPEVAAQLGDAFALNAGVIRADHAGGAGLGLAICKGIVAAHGGAMTVASEVGVGTTITARLRADLTGAMPPAEQREVA